MGIPGCGKSLCVKAISSQFQLPLYRVDMIEIFSGRHGKPEGAFVAACRMMEDLAPGVLWFDEIEMGITSTESSGEQGRIFAFFLTWMPEKARGLFVAATANRIDLLPAEMIRKGRFDEVFFVDLPQEDERIEIFRIHLSRRGVDPSGLDLAKLTQFTAGWTGAEIEQCVVSAATRGAPCQSAFDRGRSGCGGRENGTPVANDERADQPYSRVGLPARGASLAPARRWALTPEDSCLAPNIYQCCPKSN
jgi:SpoVK/Ycf46/Vps4 family AAA+-type ATPase